MEERDLTIKTAEQEKVTDSDYIIEFKSASFSWPESVSDQTEDSTKQNGLLVIKNGPYKG